MHHPEAATDHVIVLINAPDKGALDDAVVATAIDTVAPFHPELRWLNEEGRTAAEVAFTPPPSHFLPRSLEDRLRGRLMGRAVDLAVLPLGRRQKKLLIADMDSTIIGQECIDELAAAAGVGEQVAAITERAMKGELGFRDALRERVAMLKGLPETAIAEVIERRITITPGARTLVQTMKANGAYTALISGGFTPFAEYVARTVGFDCHQANDLPAAGGALTGEAAEPILGKDAKRDALERLVEKRGLSLDDALAVGDGANDADMIAAAGLGVAFHAKPVLADVADARIEHGDLTALLYLQGYTRDQFVSRRR